MNRLKAPRTSIFIVIIITVLAFSPILRVQGETVQLMYFNFYIEPSRPPLIAEGTFNITAEDDYVYGVLQEETTGSRSDSFTYFFEMYSSGHCEVYILDASGAISQYLEYQNTFAGDAPTDYTYFYICDGYLQFNMTTTISPRLIIFTGGLNVSGSFFWIEGFNAIEYNPYYLRIHAGDYPTNDTIHIFDTNASVSAYILDDNQYDIYNLDPNDRPLTIQTTIYVEYSLDLLLNYQPAVGQDYHILIWHEEYKDGVTGTIIYEYDFQKTFLANYWSFLLVLIILILIVLFTVFRKYTLPPFVWTMEKLKHYLLNVPWNQIKAYFSDIRGEFKDVFSLLRGSTLEEIEETKEEVVISPHSKRVISIVSLIFPFSLHRFLTGKIGTAIVSLLLQILAIFLFIGGLNQFIPREIYYLNDEKMVRVYDLFTGNEFTQASTPFGVIYLVLAFIIFLIYIIDITSTFTGIFEDNKKRRVLK